MKNEDIVSSALIISEITGSITTEERKVLNHLRSSYPEVATLSAFMHEVLDTRMNEILPVRTSAAKIIELAKAQQKQHDII